MTTILADARFGVMVADSSVSDQDRVWSGKKVFRVKGALIGIAGEMAYRDELLRWYRSGLVGKPPKMGVTQMLILCSSGLFFYDPTYLTPQKMEHGREAIGTGSKAAMCAYEALGFTDPKRAVQITCKHDAGSRTPVRVYRL